MDLRVRKMNYDGLCQNCGSWKFEGAEALAEGIYCDQCENRSVVGIERAIQLGILIVEVYNPSSNDKKSEGTMRSLKG